MRATTNLGVNIDSIAAINIADDSSIIGSRGLSMTSVAEQRRVKDLLDKILPVDDNASKVLPTTHLIEHRIELIEGTKPIKQRYYPVSKQIEKIMHEELEKLVEKDVEKSNNP